MAARPYRTRDGDMLDLITFRAYGGHKPGAVEAVLEANRGLRLSSYAPHLPAGLTITLPDLPVNARARLQTLWD